MTDRKGVLVRFPPDVLADLDAEAKRTGKTRHDVILDRCRRPPLISPPDINPAPKPVSPGSRSKTVVVPAKRPRVEAVAVRSGVQFGPTPVLAGERLKKR